MGEFYIPEGIDGNVINMREVSKARFDRYDRESALGGAVRDALEYIGIDPDGTYRLGLGKLGFIVLSASLVPAAIGVNVKAHDVYRQNLDRACANYVGERVNRKVALAHTRARSRYETDVNSYPSAVKAVVAPVLWARDLAVDVITLPGTEKALHDHNEAFHARRKQFY